MLKTEDLPFDGCFHGIEVGGRSADEISYHVMLLHEAGFIEAEELTSHDGVCWKTKRLTHIGHEFLDAARSHTVWVKAKAMVMQATGTLTVEGLKMALPHVMKSLMDARF